MVAQHKRLLQLGCTRDTNFSSGRPEDQSLTL